MPENVILTKDGRTERLDFGLVSRKKTLWKELRPADPSGGGLFRQPVIARESETYFYAVTRHLSSPFLVEGVG